MLRFYFVMKPTVVIRISPFFFIDNSDKSPIVGILIKNFFTLLSVVSISGFYLIEMSQFSAHSLRVVPFCYFTGNKFSLRLIHMERNWEGKR